MASTKFSPFNLFTTPYKTVHDHPILLDVLTPKALPPGRYPLFVRFHGGGLGTGSRLFERFFADWQISYILTHSAIVVCPDYRLLPESTGKDINQDLSDVWTWIREELPSFLSKSVPDLSVDLSKILVTGESAGGYFAIQSALTQPGISAVMTRFPQIDFKSPWFSTKFHKQILDMPQFPVDTIDKHLAGLPPNTVVSSVDPPGRMNLVMSMIQQGRYPEFLGEDPAFYPFDLLERASAVPPLYITHGTSDSYVPHEGSVNFVDKVKRLHPTAKVRLDLAPKEQGSHGFDADMTLEGTPWLKEGMDFLTKEWLS